MFNPKGFCPTHSKKIETVNIPKDIREKFLQEGSFLLYTIFWLESREEAFDLNQQFIHRQNEAQWKGLLEESSRNYEMKVLIYELLKQSLFRRFPSLPFLPYSKLSVLKMIFRIKDKGWMESFCRLTY